MGAQRFIRTRPRFAAVRRVAKTQTRLSNGTASPRPPEALPSGGRHHENSSVHKIPRVGRWLERHRTHGVVLLRGLLMTRKRLGTGNHGPRPGERPWLSLCPRKRRFAVLVPCCLTVCDFTVAAKIPVRTPHLPAQHTDSHANAAFTRELWGRVACAVGAGSAALQADTRGQR